jgi:hypothetical protein
MKTIAMRAPCNFLLGAALALLAGCSTGPAYRNHTVDQVVKPSGGEATTLRFRVPHGAVVKAHVVAFDSYGRRMEGDIVPADPSVIEVDHVVSGPDDYAILGLRPGRTALRLFAAGDLVREVEGEVYEGEL